MRTPLIFVASTAAAIMTFGVVAAQSQSPATPPASTPSAASAAPTAAVMQKAELRTAMRKLWEAHITYTRNAIISLLGSQPDVDAVSARLMKNQEDIGNAVKPYYGNDAGSKLTALLKEHITEAVDVVKDAKAGDKTKLAADQKKWSENGKQIADFLAAANPNWDKAMLEQMLQKHLDLTTGEVTNRLAKNWTADIKSYDDGHDHMLMFADTLTDGIAKQFPAKFTS
jgi:hypothetical protein